MKKQKIFMAIFAMIFIVAIIAILSAKLKKKQEQAVVKSFTENIMLYYYDPKKDSDESGNVMCTEKGLVPVARKIPSSGSLIEDATRLLLAGKLTAEERANGITTEYPLPGVELKSAAMENGILTLEFADPNNKTSGGSCRAGILRLQVEATAKQFPGVKSVRFLPEDIFQP
jgi:spore germination protein GerM